MKLNVPFFSQIINHLFLVQVSLSHIKLLPTSVSKKTFNALSHFSLYLWRNFRSPLLIGSKDERLHSLTFIINSNIIRNIILHYFCDLYHFESMNTFQALIKQWALDMLNFWIFVHVCKLALFFKIGILETLVLMADGHMEKLTL